MSSKILTSSAGTYYTEDSANVDLGGGAVAVAWVWNGVGASELGALTDSSDASWWGVVRPNSGDPDTVAWGSFIIAEDLTAQVPWNSTINNVTLNWKAQRDNGSTGITFRPYVRQAGTTSQPTVTGAAQSVTSTSVVDMSGAFTTDWAAAAWDLDTLFNDTDIGIRGNFTAGPGNHEGRLIKLYCTVGFTLPAPSLTFNTVTAIRSSSADLQVTANANHTFVTGGTDGYPVSVSVEWGPTIAYGNSQVVATDVSGSSNDVLTTTISGLAASTTYHFRFTATDGDNTINTIDSTFTTTSGDPVLVSF